MKRLVLMNIHQNDTCDNEIGLCALNMLTILSSNLNNYKWEHQCNYTDMNVSSFSLQYMHALKYILGLTTYLAKGGLCWGNFVLFRIR